MSAVDSTISDVKKGTLQDAVCHTKEPSSNTHDGKVVSVMGDKLVMSSKDGKEHSHKLAQDAKLTCDGKVCQAEDLKAGRTIRVTTKEDDRYVATRVESLDKNAEFAQCS